MPKALTSPRSGGIPHDDAVVLTEKQCAGLWRQRLIEATTGLQRLLAQRADREAHKASLGLFADLYRDLDDSDVPAAVWQRRFFRAQALIEEFVVARWGDSALDDWADAIADIFALLQDDVAPQALARRIAAQATAYGSRYRLELEGRDRAQLTIEHCAIWDYRERARRDGVALTLDSPCRFCTRATSANVSAAGAHADVELAESSDGHGCRWSVRGTG